MGGLGIPNLRDLNLCILVSWINRYQAPPRLWKSIIDHKYQTLAPNILWCVDKQSSPFWKGVLWAAQAVKMGYAWKVGNGRKIKIWEDQWFGSSSLVIQYWEL
jgi:hypothetical protein